MRTKFTTSVFLAFLSGAIAVHAQDARVDELMRDQKKTAELLGGFDMTTTDGVCKAALRYLQVSAMDLASDGKFGDSRESALALLMPEYEFAQTEIEQNKMRDASARSYFNEKKAAVAESAGTFLKTSKTLGIDWIKVQPQGCENFAEENKIKYLVNSGTHPLILDVSYSKSGARYVLKAFEVLGLAQIMMERMSKK